MLRLTVLLCSVSFGILCQDLANKTLEMDIPALVEPLINDTNTVFNVTSEKSDLNTLKPENTGTVGENTGTVGENTGTGGENTGTSIENGSLPTTSGDDLNKTMEMDIPALVEPRVESLLNDTNEKSVSKVTNEKSDISTTLRPESTGTSSETSSPTTNVGESTEIDILTIVESVFNETVENSVSNVKNEKSDMSTTTLSPEKTATGIKTGSPSPTNGDDVKECKNGEDCVPFYLCKNGTIVRDGSTGLFEVRLGLFERPCDDYLLTCCSVKSDIPLIPDNKLKDKTVKKDGCGYRNYFGIGFRISGDEDNESQFGEFPWTVAILKEVKAMDKIEELYHCGGSLLHPKVVLTAAHCVSGIKPSTLKIRAGEWDPKTINEVYPYQERQVKDIIIHEEYYKGGLFNDVALLFLAKPVELAENVNTICLPPQNQNFDLSRCFASGWGKEIFSNVSAYQAIMKRVEVPIVPKEKCEKELRQTRLGPYFELNKSFVCAGGERGKDTCKGDGGAPLVCPIPNSIDRYYQVGIVAYGIGCGEPIPAVYVNVPLFRNWIEEKLQKIGIPKTYFVAN